MSRHRREAEQVSGDYNLMPTKYRLSIDLVPICDKMEQVCKF